MLNWKDIGQLDVRELRNINYFSLLKEFQKRPLVTLNLAVILGTVFFVSYYLSISQNQTREAKSEIPFLEKKIQHITEYQRLEGELHQFFDEINPPLAEDELMNCITDFAVKRNIRIESFAPLKNHSDPLYHLTSMNLNITALDYRDIILFIHDIEKKLPSTRVLKLYARMETSYRQGSRRSTPTTSISGQENDKFTVDLEVASISINRPE